MRDLTSLLHEAHVLRRAEYETAGFHDGLNELPVDLHVPAEFVDDYGLGYEYGAHQRARLEAIQVERRKRSVTKLRANLAHSARMKKGFRP